MCPLSSQKSSFLVSSPDLDCGAEFVGDDLTSYRNSSLSCSGNNALASTCLRLSTVANAVLLKANETLSCQAHSGSRSGQAMDL